MANIASGAVLNERFVIIRCLGAGGFGITFHVFDLEARRNIALKILKKPNPQEYEKLALQCEHLCGNQINSPYVVRTMGFHPPKGENWAPAISFQFIEGQSLDCYYHSLETSVPLLSNEEKLFLRVNAMAQAASGLAAIHDAGFIHRDIKPDNIVVDFSSRTRILDFGLALTMDDEALSEPWGTTMFFAPELRLTGATIQTDVYALGLTLFFVLTNCMPILNLPVDLSDHLEKYLNDEDYDDITTELNEIFLTATQFEPARRFATAHEMARRLWQVASNLRAKLHNLQQGCVVEPLSGGFVGTLDKLLEFIDRKDKMANSSRMHFHRLDGLLLSPDERFSVPNLNEAFSFNYKGILYQINADTLRKALYRLLDYWRANGSSNFPTESLLTQEQLSDGVRALRLASFVPNENGQIPANGFYCYAVEDIEKLKVTGPDRI